MYQRLGKEKAKYQPYQAYMWFHWDYLKIAPSK